MWHVEEGRMPPSPELGAGIGNVHTVCKVIQSRVAAFDTNDNLEWFKIHGHGAIGYLSLQGVIHTIVHTTTNKPWSSTTVFVMGESFREDPDAA